MNDPFKEFGEDGFRALAAAFYRRIATDDVVGRFYIEERRAFAEVRMADFLIYRFGGSDRYIKHGECHAHLRLHHPWFGITPHVRDRWLELMTASMDEVGLTGPPGNDWTTSFSTPAPPSSITMERPGPPLPRSPKERNARSGGLGGVLRRVFIRQVPVLP